MTYKASILNSIENCRQCIRSMLMSSSIIKKDYTQDSNIVLYINPFFWGKKDLKKQRLALLAFRTFLERFSLIEETASVLQKKQFTRAKKVIGDILEYRGKVPESLEDAEKTIEENLAVFEGFFDLFSDKEPMIVFPDTVSIVKHSDPKDYAKFVGLDTYHFALLPTVISELDKHKHYHPNKDFQQKAKSVIKRIKGYRKQGSLLEGVQYHHTIKILVIPNEPDFTKSLAWLDPDVPDDRIIASILELMVVYPSRKVILVTSDLNMQNKAHNAGIEVLDTD